jgi:rhamnose utilization protein RhaD (predicted bifunctional aldolase and dehydrogenase)
LNSLLEDFNWSWIDYVKPGRDLTDSVQAILRDRHAPNVLILGNHGIVLGANTFDEIREMWTLISERISVIPREFSIDAASLVGRLKPWLEAGYSMPADANIHALGLDQVLIELCRSSWVLYPDHAVFLGAECNVSQGLNNNLLSDLDKKCPVVVVPDIGAVVANDITEAQSAMLSCFANVGVRIDDPHGVVCLDKKDVLSLLNWDAEKHRQSLAQMNSLIN